MNYTHCLLLTDTDYGCTVEMATTLDSKIRDYDLIVLYPCALLMIQDFSELYRYYATDHGRFNYPAQQIYSILMGAY